MAVKDLVGRFGEDTAARYLESAGLTVLQRNWRCREGEIDIVAREGDCLVVCEVKTRSGVGFGLPVEAIGRAKAARLRRLACRWVAEHRSTAAELRFDVVAVSRGGFGLRVEHIRGAF